MAELIDITDHNGRGRSLEGRRRTNILDRVPPPNAVRSLKETAAIAGISAATLRRLIKAGIGPRVTQISERRRGVTDADRQVWLEECAK
jgi:predicted DNA-binding transcriptional regulator AlpA